jgi:hypothetical protein
MWTSGGGGFLLLLLCSARQGGLFSDEDANDDDDECPLPSPSLWLRVSSGDARGKRVELSEGSDVECADAGDCWMDEEGEEEGGDDVGEEPGEAESDIWENLVLCTFFLLKRCFRRFSCLSDVLGDFLFLAMV